MSTRRTRFSFVFVVLTACGAPQATEGPVVLEPTPAQESQAPAEAAQPQDPTADPLGDVEWAPNSTEDAAREGAAPPIDLEMGDAYAPVSVNGKQPRQARTCKTTKDCNGASRPKSPGEMKCIESRCVFVPEELKLY